VFPEKTSSVAFKRPETRSRVSLYRAKRRCEKEDTTMNNDKRLILFERTGRERERKEGNAKRHCFLFHVRPIMEAPERHSKKDPGRYRE